jgi:hypothetical protein
VPARSTSAVIRPTAHLSFTASSRRCSGGGTDGSGTCALCGNRRTSMGRLVRSLLWASPVWCGLNRPVSEAERPNSWRLFQPTRRMRSRPLPPFARYCCFTPTGEVRADPLANPASHTFPTSPPRR